MSALDGETFGGKGGYDKQGVVKQAPAAEQKQTVTKIDRVAAPGERAGRNRSGRRSGVAECWRVAAASRAWLRGPDQGRVRWEVTGGEDALE